VRFLKALIVIMGVLIVIGVTVLCIELVRRMNDPDRQAEKATEKASAASPTGVVRATALGLPTGTRIGEVVVVGNRLVIKISLPAGDDRLYIVDPRTGAASELLTTGN
jgi:hypothetical protein